MFPKTRLSVSCDVKRRPSVVAQDLALAAALRGFLCVKAMWRKGCQPLRTMTPIRTLQSREQGRFSAADGVLEFSLSIVGGPEKIDIGLSCIVRDHHGSNRISTPSNNQFLEEAQLARI
ncbi:hypothetical protein PHSY_001298 [Pseudozyma hubeiensis SY62]|uniref:Uncharacterized protein n=1 Tax=Pseudozyma hubeiensis (strain SY62) TaxID=1305764 RepID=R9NY95_PSEHS|nr:hypothetical protein PHSY_001298 [Pseudozyma hubeiensis SY62]GAC93733.1 hypothetical protein PHSY_001298 [Pseudozyma hubeiensis SY62]